MTWARADYDRAMELVGQGINDCQASRMTSIPRGTIRDWRNKKVRQFNGDPKHNSNSFCPRCDGVELDAGWYAYLLGLYLGDGYIVETKPGVYKLRITLDLSYPGIIAECAEAIRRVSNKPAVTFVRKIGCVELVSYWKHWHCFFPQHGPGPKHLRKIGLEPWQHKIAKAHTARLLRGLIHSDGCRGTNRVRSKAGRWYAYPRYQFTNYSRDIRDIFCGACEEFGVRWTQMNSKVIAVSRRPDVEKLDGLIGPKT